MTKDERTALTGIMLKAIRSSDPSSNVLFLIYNRQLEEEYCKMLLTALEVYNCRGLAAAEAYLETETLPPGWKHFLPDRVAVRAAPAKSGKGKKNANKSGNSRASS